MTKGLIGSFFLLLTTFGLTLAQNGLPPVAGARGAALGNSGVVFQDIYSSFSNQAGLAYLDGFSAGIMGEQRFLINEIRSLAAAAALPTSSGTFGMALHYFGFEVYNEQRIGLSYSRLLNEKIAIGAQFDYFSTRIQDYGSAGNVTFEVGLMAQVVDDLRMGVHVFNPIRAGLLEDEPFATTLKFGLAYEPGDQIMVIAEAEKEVDYPVRFKFGLEYEVVDVFCIRIGGATEPVIASFGAGLKLSDALLIDMAAQYHLVLGWSPAIGIAYRTGQ